MQGKDDHLTVINGSYGQGGGRILRTFLALSAIHQKPVTIQHIRANRNNPGLWPQPLKGLEALAHSIGAKIKGVSMDSQGSTTLSRKEENANQKDLWKHHRFENGPVAKTGTHLPKENSA